MLNALFFVHFKFLLVVFQRRNIIHINIQLAISNIISKVLVFRLGILISTFGYRVFCISLCRVLLSISLGNTFHLTHIGSPAISLSTLTTTHEGVVELVKRCLGAMIGLDRELRSISYLLIDAVHDIISNNIALLNLLRFTTSILHKFRLLCSGQDTVHLHRTSNHPRVSLRVRVGTIHIISISRQMFQASERMLILARWIDTLLASFLLIIYISSILHLSENEVLWEKSLVSISILAVELDSVRHYTKMPAWSIG